MRRDTLTSLLFVSPLNVSVEQWELPQQVFLDLDVDIKDKELTLQVDSYTPLQDSSVSLKVKKAFERLDVL